MGDALGILWWNIIGFSTGLAHVVPGWGMDAEDVREDAGSAFFARVAGAKADGQYGADEQASTALSVFVNTFPPSAIIIGGSNVAIGVAEGDYEQVGSGLVQFAGGLRGLPRTRATIDSMIEESVRGKRSSSRQYHRSGGMSQAAQDFGDLAGSCSTTDLGGGVRGVKLPDGTTVIFRPRSSQGSPTIEIRRPTGRPLKFRYD